MLRVSLPDGDVEPVGCVNAFMQLAGAGAGDRRVGRVDRPDGVELCRRRSKRRTGQAIPAPAAGGTMPVVVLDVDPEHLLQVTSPDDQEPVQTLGTDRANQ